MRVVFKLIQLREFKEINDFCSGTESRKLIPIISDVRSYLLIILKKLLSELLQRYIVIIAPEFSLSDDVEQLSVVRNFRDAAIALERCH